MTDENNASIYYNLQTKKLVNKVCCANVKTIATASQDISNNRLYIADATLNITTEQRDEWFNDIKTAFPEFKFEVETVSDINKKLNAVKLPDGLFSTAFLRDKYVEHIKIFLKELLKNEQIESIKLINSDIDIRKLIKNSTIFIQNTNTFSIYFQHGSTGLSIFTNLANIRLQFKGEKKKISLYTYIYNKLGFDKLKSSGILVKTNFHKIDFGGETADVSMSLLFRLLMHTFLRYTWSKMYEKYLPLYFKIKEKLPNKEMLEILSLANILAHAKPYYSFFIEQNNGLLSNEFIRGKMEDHKRRKATYTTLNHLSERSLSSNYAIILKLMKEEKYKEAFNLFEFSTIGRSKKYNFQLCAKSDYGFIKEGNSYNPIFDNGSSYKIMADDYRHRWYKKSRFKKI